MLILFKPKFTWIRDNTSKRSYISDLSNQAAVDEHIKYLFENHPDFYSLEPIKIFSV